MSDIGAVLAKIDVEEHSCQEAADDLKQAKTELADLELDMVLAAADAKMAELEAGSQEVTATKRKLAALKIMSENQG
jgi:hypothetical protein